MVMQMKKKIIHSFLMAFGLGTVSLFQACTTYETPDSIAEPITRADSVATSLSRHVLWVDIDGASGSMVKQMIDGDELPHMKAMLEHSKYTFKGISDGGFGLTATCQSSTGEDPLTWATMLTGVGSYLHFVHDGSYMSDYPLNDNTLGQTVSHFPTVIQYMTSNDANLTSSVVTPWGNLNKYLSNAQSVVTTHSDDETKATVLEQLSKDDYNLTIVSLKDAWTAGKQGGFSLDNNDYKSALKKADDDLGAMLEQLKQRKNAQNEDWLVVVTSNRSGQKNGSTEGYDEADRDIFGIFYYNHYTPHEMEGETVEVPLFGSDDQLLATIADSIAEYRINGNDLALEFNIKLFPKSDGGYDNGGSWSKIMGKDTWGMFRQHGWMSVYSSRFQYNPTICNDSQWHSLFISFTKNENRYKLNYSYDGTHIYSGDVDRLSVADSSDFRIGITKFSTPYVISAVRIWDTSLDDPSIIANSNTIGALSPTDKNHAHLLAEWHLCKNGMVGDSLILNQIDGKPFLKFSHKPVFRKIANTLSGKTASCDLMMENTLVVPNILYWLCGSSSVDSKLEGINILKAFSLEEQWRDEDDN